MTDIFGTRYRPSLLAAAIPFVCLLASLLGVIVFRGADAVAGYGPWILLGSAAIALGISASGRIATRRSLVAGLRRSASQILPAVPILFCIAMVATTWMLSGVVPTLIHYGLEFLSPALFLVTACTVCAVISVMSGSSWTTIATIGVGFMGVGTVMGYSEAWIAGAIISGAYFGDKVSPLSDTTVVASSTVGVDLFTHIRYMMYTTIPAFVIALGVYLAVGMSSGASAPSEGSDIAAALEESFRISPWTLIIPAATILLIILRVKTLYVLGAATLLGAAGIFIFQPELGLGLADVLKSLAIGSAVETGNAELDELASTGGLLGMLPTVFLVLSALVFGGVMIGTGMLRKLTDAFTSRLRRRTSLVGATVATGLTMNCMTADQYLAIILTGNMYKGRYRAAGFSDKLLSRTVEDSVSVTSVLIPWNSCGLTQSTVLGVSTLAYLPFCIFNLLTPLMSILIARIGLGIPTPSRREFLPHSALR